MLVPSRLDRTRAPRSGDQSALPARAGEPFGHPEGSSMSRSGHSTPVATTLSWGVHLFTASGAVCGTLAILFIGSGRLDVAAILMLVALAIDSIDGTLARKVRVADVLPQIDGRRLDDMVDFLNFVVVPCVFMVGAGSLASPYWITVPILASAYGFSRCDAKTDDDFFLGFPSYWNILALYLWLLEIGPLGGTLWLVGLSIGVFVPFKYLYPSKLQNAALRWGVSFSGLGWAIALGTCVLLPEVAREGYWVELTLLYPAYYLFMSYKLGGFHSLSSSLSRESDVESEA